ncbi:MAG: ABC transporter ATP-binding protein [Acidimicrobiia bacterium]
MTVAPLEPVQPNTGRDNAIASVVDLRIHFKSKAGTVHAVDGVNFDIRDGETLGLVGETGCGKSVTARSFLRLVPMPPGVHVGGQVIFRPRDGEPVDLMKASESTLRDIRGNRIAMIFQDPGKALNPGLTIRDQVGEVFYAHRTDEILSDAGIDGRGAGATILERNASMKSRGAERVLLALPPLRSSRNRIRKAVNQRVAEALAETQIPNPVKVMDRYPHELSGGMRQRVMIAQALACNPDLLIADEPTTALDVTVQARILELIASLKERHNTSVLYISHDLSLVRRVCDRVAVMYAGQIAEIGGTDQIFKDPSHPYTRGLMAAVPSAHHVRGKLAAIDGTVPELIDPPAGCRFAGRCSFEADACSSADPSLQPVSAGHEVACFIHHPPTGAQGPLPSFDRSSK